MQQREKAGEEHVLTLLESTVNRGFFKINFCTQAALPSAPVNSSDVISAPRFCLIIPVGERAFASAPLRDSRALRGSCRCPRIQFPCSALSCLAVVCAVLLNSAVVSSAASRASLRTPLSPF